MSGSSDGIGSVSESFLGGGIVSSSVGRSVSVSGVGGLSGNVSGSVSDFRAL